MGAESRTQRRWEETTSFLAHVAVQLRLLSTSAINVTQWSQQMVTMFVIVTGVYLITAGELSMGGLTCPAPCCPVGSWRRLARRRV